LQEYPRKETTFWSHGQWVCEFWVSDETGRGLVKVIHRDRVRGVVNCQSEIAAADVAKRWKDRLDNGDHKFG